MSRTAVAAAVCLTAAGLFAQPSGLQFEVASIHATQFPNDFYAAGYRAGVATNPCSGSKLEISGTRISVSTAGICDMIRIAYDLQSYQVIGVPAALGFSGQDKLAPMPPSVALADTAKQPIYFYDIEARAPGSAPPTGDQVREMLRGLLTDRFHLAAHRDQRDLAYYELTVAPNGPALKPAVDGCKVRMDSTVMAACGQTTEQLARRLNAVADRVVIDRTGLTGKFDYEFPIDRSDARDFGAFVAAVQKNLKLKVEPRKGPVDVLVVDHVERPSEN